MGLMTHGTQVPKGLRALWDSGPSGTLDPMEQDSMRQDPMGLRTQWDSRPYRPQDHIGQYPMGQDTMGLRTIWDLGSYGTQDSTGQDPMGQYSVGLLTRWDTKPYVAGLCGAGLYGIHKPMGLRTLWDRLLWAGPYGTQVIMGQEPIVLRTIRASGPYGTGPYGAGPYGTQDPMGKDPMVS